MILLLRTHPGSQLFQRSTRIHGAHKSKDGWVAERHTIMALESVHQPHEQVWKAEVSAQQPILRLKDNCSTHTTPHVQANPTERGMRLMFLPPRSSHVLQPLDIGDCRREGRQHAGPGQRASAERVHCAPGDGEALPAPRGQASSGRRRRRQGQSEASPVYWGNALPRPAVGERRVSALPSCLRNDGGYQHHPSSPWTSTKAWNTSCWQ